LYVAYKVKKH